MQLSGWGRYPRIEAVGNTFETLSQLRASIGEPFAVIVHGMGRSYGDSALNDRVLFSKRFNKLLDFDPEKGIVHCESGVTLAELIDVFVPRGWFLSVTPGTRFITVGGAIASDVHGKNHHKAGCFSASVIGFRLMLPNGQTRYCSHTENKDLFLATCGGMGLTGIILDVKFKMQPVKSAYIREKTIPAGNLEQAFDLFEKHREATYSVAWIDCLAQAPRFGRSVLFLGEHSDQGGLAIPPKSSVPVPITAPNFLLNRYSAKMFNHLYHYAKARHRCRRVPLHTFFYPLDGVDNWNRLYGSRGFTQYQLVLPKDASLSGLQHVLGKISTSGIGSFLGVLKLFGPENENYLSFPMEGYTLALDFRMQKGLFPLLDELDRILMDHGGRLYLAKDVRMGRDLFRQGYPRRKAFDGIRRQYGLKEKFNSLQSKRVGI